LNKYNEIKANLMKYGDKFAEVTGDVDFGNRVIHAFERYFSSIGNDLREKREYDIGAGKGAALIAALILGADFVVGIQSL
jgi:hypothetical protein